MSVEDMAKYARRYSPSIPKATTVEQLIAKANDGIVGKQVGWMGNFNDMALKTVIRRLLSKYGYLSVEMQGAMARDNAEAMHSDRNEVIEATANTQAIDVTSVSYEEVDTETGEVTNPAANPTDLFASAGEAANNDPDY